MRDMLLSGIHTAEHLNTRREEAHQVDPRADLRRFISRNDERGTGSTASG
ncbi:hypothetical protein ACF1HJ_15905 [Streptomyces sp. NPDC013978]